VAQFFVKVFYFWFQGVKFASANATKQKEKTKKNCAIRKNKSFTLYPLLLKSAFNLYPLLLKTSFNLFRFC